MPGIEWVNTADNSNFIRSMNEMVSQFRQTKAVIEAMGEDATSVMAKMDAAGNAFKGTLREIASLAGVAFSLGQVKSFANKVVETRAYFQDIESSMKVFLGNEEKAADFTKKLKDYAYYNMFEFSDLANASKQMIAYGHSVDSIIPRLDQLSNVARGTNAPLMEMVNAYNKAKNLGGLDGKDLQSWAAKGLIVKDILKDMGEQVNGSRVSFEQFNRVLDHVTGEGGMFHNLMGEQMTNISAEQGQLEDNLASMYNKIGEKYEDVIVKWYKMQSAIVEGVTDNDFTNGLLDVGADVSEYLVDHYQEIAKVLVGLISTFGEYRATLALTRAYENVKSSSITNEEIKLLDEEISKYREIVPAKEAAKNADLVEAVAKKQLTEEDAKLIAAKRDELESLQVEKELMSEGVSYYDQVNSAKLRLLDTDLQEKVAAEKLTAAQAEEIQKRRDALAALEQEVQKRREIANVKLLDQVSGVDSEIASEREFRDAQASRIEELRKVSARRTEQISKLTSRAEGAEDEAEQASYAAEINRLKEKRLDVENEILSVINSMEESEAREADLQKKRNELTEELRQVRYQYGNDEEKLRVLSETKPILQEQLNVAQKELETKTYDYAQTQYRRMELEKELATMREQLKTQQELNRERADNGLPPITPKVTEEQIDNKQKEYQIALAEENAAAVAKEEIAEKAEAIQEKINNVVEQENTLATSANSVAKKGNTVATHTNTAAQKMHAIAVAAGSKATAIFSTMVSQARTALNGLKTAIMTNPLGIFIGAVTMALPWIIDWISGTDDASEATKQYGNVADEATSKVDSLKAVIESTDPSSKAHKEAMAELVKTYDEYGIELEKTKDSQGNEIVSTDELTKKHGALVNVLREEAIERQRAKDIEVAEEDYGKARDKAQEKASDIIGDVLDDTQKSYFFSGIDESKIDDAVEAWQRVEEARSKFGMSSKEAADAFSKYQQTLQAAAPDVERFANSLGKSAEEQEVLKKAMTAYINMMRDNKGALNDQINNINQAATAYGGNISGETDLTKTKAEAKATQVEISELFSKLEELNKAKANPEVKADGVEEAKDKVEETKETLGELNDSSTIVPVDSEQVKAAVNDAMDAIDKLQILADEEAIPEVDTDDILKAIDDSNDAITAVDNLDLSEADPTVRKEQIEAAMTRTENAISALEQLDVTKAAPGVDLTGYNATLEKLRNIKNMLASIAGMEVGEGEMQVNGKGKNFLKGFVDRGKSGLDKLSNNPKLLKAALEQKKKEYEKWFKDAHTEQQIKDFITEIDKEQANFTTTSEGYKYYQGLKERAQATTGKGMSAAAKKSAKDAAAAKKKAAQEAKKEATEAERKANEQRKAEEREAEEKRRYDLEQAKLKRDRDYAIQQERIDQMAKGSARERAQAAFDHKKRLDQIKEQERELLQREIDHQKKLYEADPKNKKARGFYAQGLDKNVKLTDEQRSGVVAETSSENAKWRQTQEEWMEADAAAMRNLLKEYGSYEQKRLAITEEYAEKVRKASNPADAASFELEGEAKLEKLQKENFAETIDWGGVFSSLEGHTKEYLEGLRDNLQALLDTGELPIDQMSIIQDKLLDINTAISEQGNMFDFIGQRTREHNRLLQQAADAQDELNKRRSEEATRNLQAFEAREAIKAYGQSIGADTTGPLDLKWLNNQFEEGSEEYERMKALLQNLFVAEGNLEQAREKTAKATVKAKNAEDAASEKTADKIARKFADAAEWVNTYLGDLPDLLGQLGLGSLGEKASGVISGINDAAGAAADFASGNYVGAAMKGISAIKGIGESLGAWSTSNRAEIEKENAKLATAMSVNSEAVNRLTEEMAKQSPTEAFKSFEMAMAALEANEQAARQTMINNANMYDGGHSLRRDLDDTYVNKIADYLGLNRGNKSWNIVDLLKNASAEQLGTLYQTPEGQELLKGLGLAIGNAEDEGNYNGLFQDILSYINDYSEEAKEQLHNTLQEAITGVSFDSFRSGFISSLMDMNKSAMDFSNDFTQQLMQSVLNAQIDKLYGDEIQSLYDQWAEAFNGDDTLTEEEVARLQAAQDELTRKMMATRDELAAATGYDSVYNQSASQKGWQSMGQETADELNGRFTALQIAGESINMNTELILANLSTMTALAQMNSGAVADIRDMMITSNSYLEDMVRYAKLTYNDFGVKIDTINKHQEEIYNAIRRA